MCELRRNSIYNGEPTTPLMSKPSKMIPVMEIKGVRVLVHWSVLLIGALILVGALEDPLLAFAVLGSYYGLILLHECGHMFAALGRGSDVLSIELYPIWGITRFTSPYSRFDHCVIAWGESQHKLSSLYH